MELKDYRARLDGIDSELLHLFSERMDIAGDIALWTRDNHMPVLDLRREKEKLKTLEEKSPEALREYTVSLFSTIMELSRSRQNRVLHPSSPETEAIEKALRETPQLFPESAIVACQGVEGAYSDIACEKLFQRPNTFYFSTFDAVFAAIDKGLCRYGVIPVENSTAGTVNAVYDLMRKHDFRIVRSVRVKVDHNLLVRPGAKLEDIREIYSHPQAIAQCAAFLQTLPNVKVIPCENTAVAAKKVFEFLFNPGGTYWSAHGAILIGNNGTVSDSSKEDAMLRCVYDSWYWDKLDGREGDPRMDDPSKFVWGDKER